VVLALTLATPSGADGNHKRARRHTKGMAAYAPAGSTPEAGEGVLLSISHPRSVWRDTMASYPGFSDQEVPITEDNTFDITLADENRRNCELAAQDAAAGAAEGLPWSEQPSYHGDSGTCFPGSP
jgi:hypothetical protein